MKGIGRMVAVSGRLTQCVLGISLLAGAVDVRSEDYVKEIKPKVFIIRDFASWKITSVRMPKRPDSELNPVKRALYDSLCEQIEEAGYEVIQEHNPEWSPGQARAKLEFKCTKGMTIDEHIRKMGFKGSEDGEDYSLYVSFLLSGKNSRGVRKKIFQVKCTMWHQFKWTNRQKTEYVKGRLKTEEGEDVLIEMTTWPFDTYGQGPRTLKLAVEEMPAVLVEKLPKTKRE